MKKAILLCIAISVGLVFGGCADQGTSSTATRASTVERGTTPGITGTGGGGGGGGFPVHAQP